MKLAAIVPVGYRGGLAIAAKSRPDFVSHTVLEAL